MRRTAPQKAWRDIASSAVLQVWKDMGTEDAEDLPSMNTTEEQVREAVRDMPVPQEQAEVAVRAWQAAKVTALPPPRIL